MIKIFSQGFRIACLLIVLLLVHACATVPVTGREQLDLVDNTEIIQMSSQQYQEVLKQSKLSSNAQQTAMIRSVGAKIQRAVESYMASKGLSSQLQGFNWEFNLIDDDKTVNAWCMPGGKVAFYTGILPICNGETGVAVVMGHEVAHAIANHGRERMSQGLLENGLLSSVQGAMGQNPTLTQQIFMQAVGAGANVGMLKFSRQQESEADHIGLIFFAKAGYDPNDAPKFWDRMIEMNKSGAPPEWLSDHPSDERRVSDLKGWIPEAQAEAKKK
jgi:predicted Zn-dependent protease